MVWDFEKIWVLTLFQTAAFLAAGLLANGRRTENNCENGTGQPPESL
jgi:hypothetical protein